MRILSGILAVFLVVFVVVQWNDPDGPIWMVIYGIAAFLRDVKPGASSTKGAQTTSRSFFLSFQSCSGTVNSESIQR